MRRPRAPWGKIVLRKSTCRCNPALVWQIYNERRDLLAFGLASLRTPLVKYGHEGESGRLQGSLFLGQDETLDFRLGRTAQAASPEPRT